MRNIPSSVYRVQISENFTLKQTITILPYLDMLGIEGLYCSPLFEAASPNGYDIINPNRISPKIGGQEDFDALCLQLKKRKMQLILDVVPNHMGIKGDHNEWWLDVLENGPSSSYADFFDIDWHALKPELKNKVLLPILGNPYGQVLINQEIALKGDGRRFWIQYDGYLLPVSKETYPFIIENDPELKRFNGEKGNHKSFDLLHELLERQHYRLAHWTVAGQEINYRRFFNINELIAIHIEKEKVFTAHHNLVFNLLKEGKVQGLRIDHPDGLYDPVEYFERLQKHNPPLVVIEKILDFHESLPLNWKVSGTVGYEFLNCLNGLFIQRNNEAEMNRVYEEFIGHKTDFEQLLYERKREYILHQMGSEMNTLGWKLDRLSELDRYYRDFTRVDLTSALREIIATFPVYRTYIRLQEEISKRDRSYLMQSIEAAKSKTPEIPSSLYDYIQKLCLFELEEGSDFILYLQQHTAPAMAKGMEDSAFYLFNRLLSLNEVGGDPKTFGISKSTFHQFNSDKRRNWPFGFLPASTQDTKRSEDVRMRLNVLSELPQEWGERVKQWSEENHQYKTKIKGEFVPDRNTEYSLYQLLLGIWSEKGSTLFFERIKTCFLKSLREAGIYTSWPLQSKEYEEASMKFLMEILSDQTFYFSFGSFHKKVSHYGRLNSLSALVLRMGGCGIVDLYQGMESWNDSLMDPDNRRPVDYTALQTTLNEGGNEKLEITNRALRFRKKYKELFLSGDYVPIQIPNEHLIAYLRQKGDQIALIVAARFYTQLPDPPIGEKCWGERFLILPKHFEVRELKDIFTGKTIYLHKMEKRTQLKIADIFEQNPFSILTNCDDA